MEHVSNTKRFFSLMYPTREQKKRRPKHFSCMTPKMSPCAMTREATLLVGCDSSVADCSDRTPPTRLRHCGELGQGTRHVNRNLGFCL
ncbi:hypothetical protein JTE90_003944 [Oedothorax gibbosus]|uniref:Uncharacterized protein n=1 Tax=Oedothorax gibbosus TaxID=931172 RepID=A0AAV6UXY3_9ARAC|nr:hypothetical protein JTE90_003944 [Oedothorax gibbosus]